MFIFNKKESMTQFFATRTNNTTHRTISSRCEKHLLVLDAKWIIISSRSEKYRKNSLGSDKMYKLMQFKEYRTPFLRVELYLPTCQSVLLFPSMCSVLSARNE